MKRTVRIFSLLLAALTALSLFSCGEAGTPDETPEIKDYAEEVKLELTSASAKQEVTVKTFIDGDTTHFYVPETVHPSGVLKARYLAVNTPESTGKIEEWGKKASEFTKEKLSGAEKIYIESDDGAWNPDSTGGRYLVWVWYRTSPSSAWRNLNLEILQNGLAVASSSANNRYGDFCVAAIAQAKAQKLNIYSGQKDPDFFYGDAVELTLRELRANLEKYKGVKVAFEGVVTMNDGQTVYVEDCDTESGVYYGMAVYYGYALSGEGLDILHRGNRSRIVGTVQYYEAGDSWQVSGLSYRAMKPDDPSNLKKISEGNAPAFLEITADDLQSRTVTFTSEDEVSEMKFSDAAIHTTVSVKGLSVRSIYTTDNPNSDNNGAMTLTCDCGGTPVTVRTGILFDEDGNLVTENALAGKVIDVRGIIDKYSGEAQIKVLSFSDITVH